MLHTMFRAGLASLVLLPAAASAEQLKTLYQFTQPFGSLGEFAVDQSGLMYGTSTQGGTAGLGTVFSFDPGTKALTVLYSFQGGSDGSTPVPGMVLSKGVLYGATAAGGPANDGTVFAFDTTTGTETVLHSFGGGEGRTPQFPPTLSANGILFGTTPIGGKSNDGTVYQIDTKSGKEKVLFDFDGNTTSDHPNALAIGPSGLLYGSCGGGSFYHDFGNIFTLDAATGSMTVLYTFTSNDRGASPSYDLVIGPSGLIYGTGSGDAFQFDPTTGALTDLNAYSHSSPTGNLVVDASGNLYGSAAYPSDGIGEIFQYNPATANVTILWRSVGFGHESKGFIPQGVVFGKGNKLYGTTPYNKVKGQLEDGTIFALAP